MSPCDFFWITTFVYFGTSHAPLSQNSRQEVNHGVFFLKIKRPPSSHNKQAKTQKYTPSTIYIPTIKVFMSFRFFVLHSHSSHENNLLIMRLSLESKEEMTIYMSSRLLLFTYSKQKYDVKKKNVEKLKITIICFKKLKERQP